MLCNLDLRLRFSVPLGVHIPCACFGLGFDEEKGVQVKMNSRKGKQLDRPLYLTCPVKGDWELGRGVQNLLFPWARVCPESEGLLKLRHGALGTNNLGSELQRELRSAEVMEPKGYLYGSNSPRIRAFNELVILKFLRAWPMNRLDWSMEGLFQVYYESQIVSTAALD